MTRTTFSMSGSHTVYTILIFLILGLSNTISNAQGFVSVTNIAPVASAKNTGEKPQSKVWTFDDKWWTVFPISDGTYIWRLDGTAWTKVLRISTSTSVKADCKVINNLCHVFLWRKEDSPSQLISLEYDATAGNYKLWSLRARTAYITLDAGTETGTIAIDNNGRMWIASDGVNDIRVRWSDSPYSTWSSPITIATGITSDDIGAVISLPIQGQIGVLWSDQNTKRFGFKTHNDGAPPEEWSANENPGSQSAVNVGAGMSDDHLHMITGSDGAIYAAVKTGYDTPGYPRVALLKRNPAGLWDNLYSVSEIGTRPIVVLNESKGRLKVIYTSHEDGGDILYREAVASNISFGPAMMLRSGVYNNPTSSKNNYDSEIVILVSDETHITGVIGDDYPASVLPDMPTLASPADLASQLSVNPTLTWNAADNATSYRLQLSLDPDFSTVAFDQTNVQELSFSPHDLLYNTHYYWRVQSANSAGTSEWSAAWSFTTYNLPPPAPTQISPANLATGVIVNPTLKWNAAVHTDSYEVELSGTNDFSEIILEQGGITNTSWQVTGLQHLTTYYWRVRAINGMGASSWSPVWSFVTVDFISSNLVAYWPGEEGGGSTLVDNSEFGNHGAIQGTPAWVTGVSGSALKLNGTSQYVVVNDAPSLDVTTGITLAAWIKPEKLGSQHLIEKGSEENSDGYELTLLSTGKVSFRFNQRTSSTFKINSRLLYPTNGTTWMHIAATYNGTVARIYIDGVENKSISFTPVNINQNDLDLTIGASIDGSSLFKGTLDDVRIYNYALASDEISALASQNTIAAARIGNSTLLNTIDKAVAENLTVEEAKPVKVYPNPAKDILNIELEGTNDSDVGIAILDPFGHEDFRGIRRTTGNTLSLDLKELKLAVGLHLLYIKTEQYFKVIKINKI